MRDKADKIHTIVNNTQARHNSMNSEGRAFIEHLDTLQTNYTSLALVLKDRIRLLNKIKNTSSSRTDYEFREIIL